MFQNIDNNKSMDLTELSLLRRGLKLYAGAIRKVADTAKVDPAYVSRVLRGETGENPTTLRIVQVSRDTLNQLIEETESVSEQLAAFQ